MRPCCWNSHTLVDDERWHFLSSSIGAAYDSTCFCMLRTYNFSPTNFCSLGILVTFFSSTFQLHRGSVILYICIMPVTYFLNQARTDCCMKDEAQFLLICDAFLTLSFLWHCIKLRCHLYPAASYFTLKPFILFSCAYLYAVCQTFLPVSGKPF